jgi:hypothetical protein
MSIDKTISYNEAAKACKAQLKPRPPVLGTVTKQGGAGQ